MRPKKFWVILCACLACLCLVAIGIVIISRSITPEPAYTIPRHIQYSFTLQNRTNHLVKEAKLWTYAPVKQTATQQCMNVEASHPFQVISDDLGNQILHFTFRNLPPYAAKIITIKAELLLSTTPNNVSVRDLRAYVKAEKYCESDNPEISRLAAKLKAPEPDKTAENIFRWVASSVRHSGYLRNPRGALYALRNKKGDCTEFMYLFAALCRASKIPARGMGGYLARENAVLKPNAYHNWAEFYHDGVWRIADPQRKIFMQNQSHYIAMQVLAQSPANPMGNFHRFRCAGEGLKVKMNG